MTDKITPAVTLLDNNHFIGTLFRVTYWSEIIITIYLTLTFGLAINVIVTIDHVHSVIIWTSKF